MKIVSQNHFNECGICVANMLINHYQKTEVPKAELLSQCNLSRDGLTLLELELLCEKYGVKLDSYQLGWHELFETDNHKPFITIFEINNMLHYVVGIIKNETLYIYDPSNQIYSFKKTNPPTNWLGIVSFSKFSKVKFEPIKFKNINIFNSFSPISWVFVLTEVVEFAISIILSLFMSKVMNLNQSYVFMSSVWKISFIFIAILVLNETFSILNFLIKNWYFKNVFKISSYTFFESLTYKKNNFFKNYSRFEIIQLFDFLNKIIHLQCFFLSDFFSEIIVAVTTLTLIILIQSQMFILVLSSIVLLLIVYSINLWINRKYLKKMFVKQIEVQENINNFIEYKLKIQNVNWDISWVNQIVFQIDNFYKNSLSYSWKKELIKTSLNILNQIINFSIFLLVWNNQEFVIGKLFIIASLFSLFNKSINSCLSSVINFYSLKPIIKKFNDLNMNNEANSNYGITFDEVKSLTFDNVVFQKNLCINTNDLHLNKNVNNLLNINSNTAFPLQINKINLKEYSSIYVQQNVVFIDSSNTNFYNDWRVLIPKNNFLYKEIVNYIDKKFHDEILVSKFKELSIEFRSFLLFISCLTARNKIICLNNIFDYILSDDYELIKSIFEQINETNFVIANLNTDIWLGLYENLI